MTEEVLHNKKNLTGLILTLACEELRDVGDVVRYLRSRLYTDEDIFQIFQMLVRKQKRIKRALSGRE